VVGFADPGITPNSDGLPGLAVVKTMVGALLTWGLVACVAGLVLAVVVWAVAHHQGNYSQAASGKTGVLVAIGGAILIGGCRRVGRDALGGPTAARRAADRRRGAARRRRTLSRGIR